MVSMKKTGFLSHSGSYCIVWLLARIMSGMRLLMVNTLVNYANIVCDMDGLSKLNGS